MTQSLPVQGSIAAADGVIHGTLSSSDPINPDRVGHYCEQYEITGVVLGQAIEVSLETGGDGSLEAGFDAYLQIINAGTGAIVAADDESGGNGNARLTFMPAAGITYLARVTTYSPLETGVFSLQTRLVQPIDLQVIAATAPATASNGSVINLSWTTRNNGPGVAEFDWIDNIYFSTDTILDAGDTLVAEHWPEELFNPLPAGASRSASLQFMVAGVSTDGLYYLLINADSASNQAEVNEANNNLAVPISMDANGSDLRLTTASAPANASIGSPFNVSWTVRNNGTRVAESDWWDAVYLSTDANYDDSDRWIGSYPAFELSPLAVGASYTLTQMISVSELPAAGSYYLVFHADAYANEGETSETNNTLALPISIDTNGPDLELIGASAAASTSVGSAINLSWTVRNSGTRVAEADWWDGIYLSTDASYDYSDTFINSFSAADFSPLAPGGSYTFHQTVSTPGVAAAGSYYLIFRSDPYTNQGETSETNNTLALPISIDTNGPDLELIGASAAASTSVGSAINLSWTVRNSGTRVAEADWWDGIYLSTDASYDYSDTFINSFSAAEFSPLAPGGSYTFHQTVSTPGVAAAGSYYLIFRSDPYTNQGETSEANNSLALPISIDTNGPDLELTSASAAVSASVGSSLSVSWTVRNAGNRAASGYWSDAIYLSDDNRFDYRDTFLIGYGANAQSPLNAESGYSQSLSVSIPESTTRRLSGKKSARGAALSSFQSLLRVEHHGLRVRQMAVIESWSEAKD